MSEIQETEREEHKLREAYGALSLRVKELLQAARERVDASQVKAAVERAGEELRQAGRHTETALARAAEVVRKEWGGITGKAREEARAAYAELAERTGHLLGGIKEKVNAGQIRRAVDQAAQEMRELGEHTEEALAHATEALKKDMASTAERMGPAWERFKEQTRNLFAVWEDRSAVFLGQAAEAVGQWLAETGGHLEHRSYHTGELTYGGEFQCTTCGEHLKLGHPGYVPPCPQCMGTEFRRV